MYKILLYHMKLIAHIINIVTPYLVKQLRKTALYKALLRMHIARLKKQQAMLTAIKNAIPYKVKKSIKELLYHSVRDRNTFHEHKKKLLEIQKPTAKTLLPYTVSVIIPTKNAGEQFEIVLTRIRMQQYIHRIEIIVVDSGSTDNTVQRAKQYDARVISIKPQDFSHSTARNRGAQAATGEYLVFTVQDAFLLNQETLYDLVQCTNQNKLAATSGYQIPRADSDFFGAWQVHTYMDMITPHKQNLIIEKSEDAKSTEDRRKQCVLDDVLVLHDARIFRKMKGYNEDYPFGEDLELGNRVVENGYKLGFLATNGAIHSHTRPPSYLIKRFYTDTVFLHTLFPDTRTQDPYPEMTLPEIMSAYLQFFSQLARSTLLRDKKNAIAQIGTRFVHTKTKKQTKELPLTLPTCIEEMQKKCAIALQQTIPQKHMSFIQTRLQAVLAHMNPAIAAYYNTRTNPHAEYYELLDKIGALLMGSDLALHYVYKENKHTQQDKKLHTYLLQNV